MSTIDARQELERIRTARDDGEPSTEPAETFTCPIDGCSRTVVGSPKHLRSHVRQAGDAAHRFRTLNEKLEIETKWSAMNWGPGPPK